MHRMHEFWHRLPTQSVDVVIAVAVLAAELVNAVLRIDDQCSVCDVDLRRILVVLAMSLPLIWRRSHPLVVYLAIGLAAAYNGAIDAPALNMGIIVAVYSIAAYAPARVAWAALVVTVAALMAIHLDRGELGPEFRLDLTAFIPVWLLGRLAAARMRHIADLQARAEMAERDREQRAALAAGDERRRIAREIHDIVAHGMSVMVVHSQNASDALDDDPDSARRSLEIVSETGRSGIAELRRVLGVLRDDSAAELAPQPTMNDIVPLVDRFRDAGLPVSITMSGDPSTVPNAVAASAHGIIREALTNALRHSSASTVDVGLETGPAELALLVTDDGTGPNGDSGGHGLTGIRERVAAMGGTVEIGTGPDGGFRVAARLPLEAPR